MFQRTHAGNQTPTWNYLDAQRTNLQWISASRSKISTKRIIWFSRKGASAVLYDDTRRVCTRFTTVSNWQALREGGQKATYISITSTIRVDELLLWQSKDSMLSHVPMNSNDGGVLALSYHNSAVMALRTWNQGDTRGNEFDIRGFPALCFCPCQSLCLIAEEEINHGQDLSDERLKRRHLHQEWRRQV